MLFGYLIYIHIQTEKSGQSSNRIELKHTEPKQHTPLSVEGGLHCPFNPLGPRIECLERVSSFGGGRVRDLQKFSKNVGDLLFSKKNNAGQSNLWTNLKNQHRLKLFISSSATTSNIIKQVFKPKTVVKPCCIWLLVLEDANVFPFLII